MIKVGITGGIGSGKSYVSNVFKKLDVPVYSADDAGKRLMLTSENVKQAVSDLFGKQAYIGTELNRKYIANQVFKNKDQLENLNEIIHPAVEQDFVCWCIKQKHKKYILKEAAILFESGSHKQLDKIIVVDAPLEVKIARVMLRDGSSREDVVNRMNNQWPADKIKSLADFIINNGRNILILPQIIEIHKKLTF